MPDLTASRIVKASGATVVDNSSILDDGVKVTFTTPIVQRPAASVLPTNNGEVVMELTSNTTITVKAKGSDGTVRSATLTLA